MNKRKIYIMLMMMISLSILSGIVSGIENQSNQSSMRDPIVYKSLIDTSGFRKVLNMTSNNLAPYQNNTLNIYKGDKVIWVNDESAEKRFTIISKQKLWKNESGVLGARDKQFSYVFNKTGTYIIYLKEYPELKSQRIIVESTNMVRTNTSKVSKTNTSTKSPKKIDKKKTIKITKPVSKSSNNIIVPIIIVLIILVVLTVSFKYKEKIKEKIKEYKNKIKK